MDINPYHIGRQYFIADVSGSSNLSGSSSMVFTEVNTYLRCRIRVIDLSIVAGHLISNCSLKFDKYICLMVYVLHGKTKQKQPSLMRCVCVCWLCFCFDNFVLDCSLLCQLDVR